ncbi:MAG: DUF1992 domain-containing protein [Anaerolineae bacterium]|nr:MAG: hypothetical protein UZ13_03697 [Chloroflexi bacterium OLB13]MBW7878023.1 DUF1992 domain-containing protein [Anaerolineae bacterium]
MDWESSLDERVRQAIGDGSNLPNAGKRLELDDPYTPDELKLAYKLLKDNDLTPGWILEGRELDDLLAQARQQLARALKSGAALPESISAGITALNKRVLAYNLKAPPGVSHKRMIDVEIERRRLTCG